MRVFISADIEGITTTTLWEECNRTQPTYAAAAQQMTNEVKAACEGAIDAGADFILVKDAHASGTNLDIRQLPRCVELIRSGCGHPYTMAYGVDQGFDAAMFIGYHSAAGRNGSPLSHTFSQKPLEVRLNGQICSEFMLFSLVANYEKVPTVLLTGDKMLCEDSTAMYPLLKTVAVKEGFGSMTRSIHPELACERIRAAACAALKQDLSKGLIDMPEKFIFEITYKEHANAVSMSYYPGFSLIGDRTIRMETANYVDVVRAVKFVL